MADFFVIISSMHAKTVNFYIQFLINTFKILEKVLTYKEMGMSGY